jgi:hypothetical protein
MKHKGKVYKFTGIYGLIRPDEWDNARRDVLFLKRNFDLKIGDKVTYEYYENNGRRYTKEMQKLDT